jgi:ribonuclease Z
MQVEFLGTAGYHPTETRHTSCVVVPELGLVFDAGTGLFRATRKLAGRDVTLFISHAHLDHISGLTYLLVPLLRGQIASARVVTAPEYHAAIREHLFAKAVFPILPECDWATLSETVALANGWSVASRRLTRHEGGSTAFRLDDPTGARRLAVVTDVTCDDSYLDFIAGSQVLIHECNFPDELAQWAEPTGHSHLTPVCELARRAGVGQLWLTHFDPLLDDRMPVNLAVGRAIFPQTYLAMDGVTFEA